MNALKKNDNPSQRFGYLDAARGIAACMVMCYHYVGWKYPEKLSVKLSHFIFNGSDAVSFFFVLSGFVLAFPYLQGNKKLDVGKFYINRIFRIYPAFLIALLLNSLYWMRHDLMQSPLSTLYHLLIENNSRFWEEALLIKGRSKFLGLDWTLTVEMVMSFFIPFLISMVFKNKRLIIWFVFSTFLMSNLLGIYVLPFALGMLVSVYFKEIQSPEFKQTKWYRFRLIILISAVLMYSIRHIDAIFPLGGSLKYLLNLFQLDFFVFTAIASFVFLVFIIHSRKAQQFLEHPILLFLGKISYGIYLLHWVIVSAIYDYWVRIVSCFPNEKIAFLVMMVVCSALTIITATALHYLVEIPFINKGKRYTMKWKPTIEI